MTCEGIAILCLFETDLDPEWDLTRHTLKDRYISGMATAICGKNLLMSQPGAAALAEDIIARPFLPMGLCPGTSDFLAYYNERPSIYLWMFLNIQQLPVSRIVSFKHPQSGNIPTDANFFPFIIIYRIRIVYPNISIAIEGIKIC